MLHHPDFCALEARWRSLRHLTALVTSPPAGGYPPAGSLLAAAGPGAEYRL
ncbi:hypothetical protein [Morganella morganii]|uniref:hypothetical protein n=1 Tax=Morganella morganii TaxID=582 RepID=UPI00351AC880